MIDYNQAWMILQQETLVLDRLPAFVYCDQQQHLFVFNHSTNKNTRSFDGSNLTNNRATNARIVQTIIHLECIQYIQRIDKNKRRRSAFHYHHNNTEKQQLEIYYSIDRPRSEYLYKNICIQLIKSKHEFNQWINALYIVIDEAKNLNELGRRNRWLLRQHEKLKRLSGSLTFDSINNWLNFHVGRIYKKEDVKKQIEENKIVHQSNEITDTIFRAIYNFIVNKQQKVKC